MTRIDRRALFTSGAAAAVLAATGASVDAAPRRGGVLRLALPRQDGLLEMLVRGAVYETLTEIGPDGVLKPELATSWRSSPDARVWHFDIRAGVQFHDGSELMPEDVSASIKAHKFPVEILGIRVVEDRTVMLELSEPNSDLPYLLADPTFFIAQGGSVETPLDNANGTGLYRVTGFQDGRQFRAERVASHYKDGHAGWVDQIEAIVIPDAGVRAEALREGYVDVAALPDVQGLINRGEFTFYPSDKDTDLAVGKRAGMPKRIGIRSPLDDGRISERWWVL
ncbi:MAG: ABC transporter substrate-binding protein [Paracoccaceae bacterium]|jgi:ABC-type transport system substrate-binding protein